MLTLDEIPAAGRFTVWVNRGKTNIPYEFSQATAKLIAQFLKENDLREHHELRVTISQGKVTSDYEPYTIDVTPV